MKNLNAETAALMLARGKAGMCSILATPDNRAEFLGFGIRRPLRLLRLVINGEVFTEQSIPWNLIMRTSKPGRPSWAVLADSDWNTLSVSTNSDASITCLALIEPDPSSKNQSKDGNSSIPLGLKARFDSACSAVFVCYQDLNFAELVAAEAAEMFPIDKECGETCEI